MSAPAATRAPEVTIIYRDDGDSRDRAVRVADALRRGGYAVSGFVEGGEEVRQAVVRFHDDRDAANAARLTGWVSSVLPGDLGRRGTELSDLSASAAAPQGTIELVVP